MNLDQRLTEAMMAAADLHAPPAPDLDRLLAGGRRRQRQRDVRRVTLAAITAAVLAVATPFAVGALRHQQPVQPTAPEHQLVTDLPVGAPPAIPYCYGDGTVMASGHSIRARCDVLIHRGDATLLATPQGLDLLRDGRRTLLDGRPWTAWFPAMSRDGRYAAWLTPRPHSKGAGELLVFDLASGRQIADEPIPSAHGWVPGIDDLGRVYVELFHGGVLAYDIGSGSTVQVRGLPSRVTDGARIRFITADGFGMQTHSASRDEVVGLVTDDGRFASQRAVTQGWSVYSPDSSRFVQDTGHGLATFDASGADGPVALHLPPTGGPLWYPVWETDDSLLVEFDPNAIGSTIEGSNGDRAPAGSTYLLRCSATTGECEVALEPGWSGGMEDPVYR